MTRGPCVQRKLDQKERVPLNLLTPWVRPLYRSLDYTPEKGEYKLTRSCEMTEIEKIAK